MANKLEEPRGALYSFFIFIIIIISSLSLPIRFQSFGSNFTKFLDTNDRHYIFLLCNGILFFLLFLDSGSNHEGPQAKEIECNEIKYEDLDRGLVVHSPVEVKQIELQNGMLVNVDDDRSEDPETDIIRDVDYEHEIVALCEVEDEDEEQDDEDIFRQKCEEFIRKMRQSMHYERKPILRSL